MREICKNYLRMYVPEYTITSEILKNVASCEYNKALIESLTVLPSWRKQLQKEAQLRTIKHTLGTDGFFFEEEAIKRYLDRLTRAASTEVKNLFATLKTLDELARVKELDELGIKDIHKTLTKGLLPQSKQGRYRSTKLPESTSPEEILAQIVELFDWYNGLDAQETHPLLASGIMLSQMEQIKPFDAMNSSIAKITARLCMKARGYAINDYYCAEAFFDQNKLDYARAMGSTKEGDLTSWLEFYTDVFARELSNIKEKMLLLAKDTKLAKASGRAALTERQEKIVEFLQDYGILQNKAFPKLFPKVSEDSVLRDIKVLLDMDIIVKRGRTKSSRYELK